MAKLPGFRRRKAFSVVTDSTATSRNAQLTVPKGYDDLWDIIDANGYGIQITEANGVTPIAFNRVSWTLATRVLTLDIEAAPTPAATGRCVCYWLYYSPTATASDESVAVATSSQLTASMDLAAPVDASILPVIPQRPGATVPDQVIAKGTDGEIFVWLDFTSELQHATGPMYGSTAYEEAAVARVEVLDSSGITVGSMTSATEQRWLSVRSGATERIYLKLRVLAGTDGQRYTLIGEYNTTTPAETSYRKIPHRVGIEVRDQLSAAASATVGQGWAAFADSTHTIGSPQAFTAATRAQWTNDGATSEETYWTGDPLWASNAVDVAAAGQAYMMRIDFIIDPGTSTTAITLDFDVGSDAFGASSEIVWSRTYALSGGAGAQVFSASVPIEVLASFLANGGRIGLTASTNSDVYSKKIRIFRIF